jgi:hypothetical protein
LPRPLDAVSGEEGAVDVRRQGSEAEVFVASVSVSQEHHRFFFATLSEPGQLDIH